MLALRAVRADIHQVQWPTGAATVAGVVAALTFVVLVAGYFGVIGWLLR